MRITYLLSICLTLCTVSAILVVTFPQTGTKKQMQVRQKRFLWSYIAVNAALSIAFIAVAHSKLCVGTIMLDKQLSLLLVPIISCLHFSIFLYYPLVRILMNENIKDREISDTLMRLLFECAFGETDNREKSLNELENLCLDYKDDFMAPYGLDIYLDEYIKRADTTSHKPSLELIRYVMRQCGEVKCEIDNYSPTPFSNISLVFSFTLSTIITIIVSVIEQLY